MFGLVVHKNEKHQVKIKVYYAYNHKEQLLD